MSLGDCLTTSVGQCLSINQFMPEVCRKWIKKQNLNALFLKKDKIHQMKTRAMEKYKVQHANTERLKNSSIMAMQKMLNHDARI